MNKQCIVLYLYAYENELLRSIENHTTVVCHEHTPSIIEMDMQSIFNRLIMNIVA